MAAVIAAMPCAAAAQNIVSMPVDDDFGDVSMRWNGATPGGYDARAAVKNIGGKIALCGVGAVTNIQLNAAIQNGLRGGSLKINGKTAIKNFTFFARAKNARSVERTNANCKVSTMAAPAKLDKVDFRYGKATFRN